MLLCRCAYSIGANNIGAEGAVAFAEALKNNNRLKVLK